MQGLLLTDRVVVPPGSAKMKLGAEPEAVLAAYRIGDSPMKALTPINAYTNAITMTAPITIRISPATSIGSRLLDTMSRPLAASPVRVIRFFLPFASCSMTRSKVAN